MLHSDAIFIPCSKINSRVNKFLKNDKKFLNQSLFLRFFARGTSVCPPLALFHGRSRSSIPYFSWSFLIGYEQLLIYGHTFLLSVLYNGTYC